MRIGAFCAAGAALAAALLGASPADTAEAVAAAVHSCHRWVPQSAVPRAPVDDISLAQDEQLS